MADHRHKRETKARRKPKALRHHGPLAVLATASVVTSASWPPTRTRVSRRWRRSPAPQRLPATVERSDAVRLPRPSTASRPPHSRTCRVRRYMSKAADPRPRSRRDTKLWTTDELNIWTQPGDKAKLLGEIEAGKKVLVTGREMSGRDRDRPQGRVPLGHRRLPLRREAPDARRRTAPTAPRSRAGVSEQRQGRPPRGLRRLPRDHRPTARCAAATVTMPAAGPSTSW